MTHPLCPNQKKTNKLVIFHSDKRFANIHVQQQESFIVPQRPEGDATTPYNVGSPLPFVLIINSDPITDSTRRTHSATIKR